MLGFEKVLKGPFMLFGRDHQDIKIIRVIGFGQIREARLFKIHVLEYIRDLMLERTGCKEGSIGVVDFSGVIDFVVACDELLIETCRTSLVEPF